MKIHFIGIGGIGVSALAQYYLSIGAEVSGSDLVSSEITNLLKKKGAKIIIEKHNAKNISNDTDLVIYSPAVEKNNPELLQVKKFQVLGFKLQSLSYPEALGELTKEYFTIAVSGTHGKSTTTSMLSLVLIKAGIDPTVIVGTKLKEFGNSNFRKGNSKYLVIEADEWSASFLSYWPQIIILTNIEREHLDYYKDLNHILKTFKEYIGHLPKYGLIVANKDNENITKLLKNSSFKIENYSLKQPEAKTLKKILKVPGVHNISNAMAALTVARSLNIPDKVSFKTLSEYMGAWRRFDISRKIINDKRITIVNDYGHHPTEIKATLISAREKYPKEKIWCVFQPHQYQRTFNLFKDFVKVFKNASIDRIIITDIYSVAGREKSAIKKKVNSQKLIKAVNKPSVIYLAKKDIKNYLKKNIKEIEVLFIMGAGDIYDLNKEL
ncbi:UDP-N-acetylmuramate--L-alanine ligase [Patescibacteria group bacterium]|nr:UDP-N-acetylmuramate--L-alanine ligase [Patescibacteria group bacterium]